MIEEIDSGQYVQHYFEKVYTELEHSPESFLRAALEFVQRQGVLLSQPGAMESLVRLAETIANRDGAVASPASSPETAPPHPPAPPREEEIPQETSTPAIPTPSAPSVEMQDAAAVSPAAPELGEEAETSSKLWRTYKFPNDTLKINFRCLILMLTSFLFLYTAVNAGNGADFPTYSWTQTLAEVVIIIPVPAGTKGKMCDVSITRTHLRAGLRGSEPIIDGEFPMAVKVDDSFWNVVDGKVLEITLCKIDDIQWWKAVVVGHPEIDPTSVEPQASSLSDLDGEMRGMVEKMMFDQRQKALGLPTSEDTAKQDAYKKFMDAHPDMDFSQAKFM